MDNVIVNAHSSGNTDRRARVLESSRQPAPLRGRRTTKGNEID
jgi:hypothetical protein